MKPTTFLIVLAATAVSVAAAGYAVVTESQRGAPAAAPGGPLFGELLAQANEVRTVTVESAKGKLTIAHGESGWVLTEKDDYPVAADKVRKLVAGLGGLRLLEAKTDRPERLARLEVEDVAAADSKSRQVTLAGADGAPLAVEVAETDAGDVLRRRSKRAHRPMAAGNALGAQEVGDVLERPAIDRRPIPIGPAHLRRSPGERPGAGVWRSDDVGQGVSPITAIRCGEIAGWGPIAQAALCFNSHPSLPGLSRQSIGYLHLRNCRMDHLYVGVVAGSLATRPACVGSQGHAARPRARSQARVPGAHPVG